MNWQNKNILNEMTQKVAIIILNWNGWKDTIECLESVFRIDYPNYQVIVVDNGSTDNSVVMIKKWIGKRKKIFLIQNKKNLGFAAGNNLGIKFAMKLGADYFLILNNDTIIEPETLLELTNVLGKKKEYGVVGPSIYFYNNSNKLQFSKYKKVKKIIEDVSISGCCFLIKKEIIKKIGFLDPAFFLFTEEKDFMIRAKEAGYNVLYVPTKSKVLHKFSATVSQYSKIQHYHMGRSVIILLKKHPMTLLSVILFLVIHTIKILRIKPIEIKYLIQGVINGFRYKIRRI